MKTLPMEESIEWGDQRWHLEIDSASGSLLQITNRDDPTRMNWLRNCGHWANGIWFDGDSKNKVRNNSHWGLIETQLNGMMRLGDLCQLNDRSWEMTYPGEVLSIKVTRRLDDCGNLLESYTFQNAGALPLYLPVGSIAILTPFFDQYPDALRSLSSRCHTHVWMGGTCSWINATRMGGESPHLGLALTEGSLACYSQRGGCNSDRGIFLLHPDAMMIPSSGSRTISWKLFWHTGWDDFFTKVSKVPNFIRLSAKEYTVTVGQYLEIEAESCSPLHYVKVRVNGTLKEPTILGNKANLRFMTMEIGEVLIEWLGENQHTWIRCNVIAPQEILIAARVQFIVRHQQSLAPGEPQDGAYLSYDNELAQLVYNPDVNDHNAGRERLGMGVLAALYLQLCEDKGFRNEIEVSLKRYAEFVARELEDEEGVVYNSVGRVYLDRLYNFPLAAQFHLAMYHSIGDHSQLDIFVRIIRAYYIRGGTRYYGIGIPITEGLNALATAGRTAEYKELLGYFVSNADHIVHRGINYPPFEVNFEQSIVAPAVQILAEVYQVTKKEVYLNEMRRQMPILEAFCGKQPDFRLHEIAIRHWDAYWFGKTRVYGDTFPHYWSTLNAIAYAQYALITKETSWIERACSVLKANLSLFAPDGRASCAFLYPYSCNDQPGNLKDSWSNDQDWALVNLLAVKQIERLLMFR